MADEVADEVLVQYVYEGVGKSLANVSHRISVSCRQEFARLTPTPSYKKVAKGRAPSTIHSPDRITYRRAQRPALIQAGSEAHQVPICFYYSMHSYFSIYQIY